MWAMGGKCPYKLAFNQFTAIFTYNIFNIEDQMLKIFQISVLIFTTPPPPPLFNVGSFLPKIQVRGQISCLPPPPAGASDAGIQTWRSCYFKF
jgi:hypothetical protein